VRGGSFRATYADGATEQYGDSEPQFTVRLRDDDIFVFLGDGLSMSFGEASMDGRVDVEGDLADLDSLALRGGLISATGTAQGLTGIFSFHAADGANYCSHAKTSTRRSSDARY